MKFILKGIKENVYTLMRKIGYYFLKKDERTSEYSFVKPLAGGGYPRFHLFLKIEDSPPTKFSDNSNLTHNHQMTSKDRNLVEGKNWIFNLHLDQKKPSYQGAPAHAGTYEAGPVEKEAERIKEIFKK